MDPKFTQKRMTARRVILTSFTVDIIDVIGNLTIALLTGSIIMVTEVFEGLSDLAASSLLLLGHTRSMRKEDRDHPFGYGREIYFWTLMAALIMFGATSTLSIYFGWQRFIHPHPVHSLGLALGVLFLTIATNGYAFLISYRRLIRNRPFKHVLRIFYRSSLVETKTTFILDFMGTVAAIIGIISLSISIKTGESRFDGLGAMVIGVVLAFLALLLLAGIRDLLVGKSASPETESQIRKAALRVDEVDDVLDLKTLHVGNERLLVTLDVHMQSKLTTRELEKLIDKIKASIRDEVPQVRYLQVELETPKD
jgi:cation diffusion facilitator family transporter